MARPFAELLADVRFDFPENAPRVCLRHPEKVSHDNIVEALGALLVRFEQPTHHVRRTYKCRSCYCWHFTSSVRTEVPADPFPRLFWYGVVIEGSRVWQSTDVGQARRYARKHRGVVVPFEQKRPKSSTVEGTSTP